MTKEVLGLEFRPKPALTVTTVDTGEFLRSASMLIAAASEETQMSLYEVTEYGGRPRMIWYNAFYSIILTEDYMELSNQLTKLFQESILADFFILTINWKNEQKLYYP